MNATCLLAMLSPTRRERERGSPGLCRVASDHSGSRDSVTITTCTSWHAGHDSGSLVSTGLAKLSPRHACPPTGPVTESKGLRSMMACPLLVAVGAGGLESCFCG